MPLVTKYLMVLRPCGPLLGDDHHLWATLKCTCLPVLDLYIARNKRRHLLSLTIRGKPQHAAHSGRASTLAASKGSGRKWV